MISEKVRQNLQAFINNGAAPTWEGNDGFHGTITKAFKGNAYYLVEVTNGRESADIIAGLYRQNQCPSRITRLKDYFYVWAKAAKSKGKAALIEWADPGGFLRAQEEYRRGQGAEHNT